MSYSFHFKSTYFIFMLVNRLIIVEIIYFEQRNMSTFQGTVRVLF